MAEETQQAATELINTVVIYGLRKRHRALRLANSLAEIPCYPSVIFRIDQQGRYFGAIDQLRKPARIYYIRVINWCDRNQALPVTSFTLRPDTFARGLGKKARWKLAEYSSKLRASAPLTIELSFQEHAALYAKMTRGAS